MDSDTLWKISLGMVWFVFIGKLFVRLNEKYEGLKQSYPLAGNLPVSYTHLTLPTTPYV